MPSDPYLHFPQLNERAPAFMCHVCHSGPDWRIVRCDAVVDWACHEHLAAVCAHLQRIPEVTELVVVDYRKAVEWNGIGRSLRAIAEGTA